MHPPTAKRKGNALPGIPGRPKDPSKGEAIMNAAKTLFVKQGFEHVSMDEIASAAGVSKLTVYSHYGDKESLFSAAVACRCEELLGNDVFVPDPNKPLRAQLLSIARVLFDLITSEDALAIHRLISALPPPTKLGQLYWEAGPRRIQEDFEAYLRGQVQRGRLELADAHQAASQFCSLVKGEVHSKLLCGCGACDPKDIETHLQGAVDMFLRAYAPRRTLTA